MKKKIKLKWKKSKKIHHLSRNFFLFSSQEMSNPEEQENDYILFCAVRQAGVAELQKGDKEMDWQDRFNAHALFQISIPQPLQEASLNDMIQYATFVADKIREQYQNILDVNYPIAFLVNAKKATIGFIGGKQSFDSPEKRVNSSTFALVVKACRLKDMQPCTSFAKTKKAKNTHKKINPSDDIARKYINTNLFDELSRKTLMRTSIDIDKFVTVLSGYQCPPGWKSGDANVSFAPAVSRAASVVNRSPSVVNRSPSVTIPPTPQPVFSIAGDDRNSGGAFQPIPFSQQQQPIRPSPMQAQAPYVFAPPQAPTPQQQQQSLISYTQQPQRQQPSGGFQQTAWPNLPVGEELPRMNTGTEQGASSPEDPLRFTVIVVANYTENRKSYRKMFKRSVEAENQYIAFNKALNSIFGVKAPKKDKDALPIWIPIHEFSMGTGIGRVSLFTQPSEKRSAKKVKRIVAYFFRENVSYLDINRVPRTVAYSLSVQDQEPQHEAFLNDAHLDVMSTKGLALYQDLLLDTSGMQSYINQKRTDARQGNIFPLMEQGKLSQHVAPIADYPTDPKERMERAYSLLQTHYPWVLQEILGQPGVAEMLFEKNVSEKAKKDRLRKILSEQNMFNRAKDNLRARSACAQLDQDLQLLRDTFNDTASDYIYKEAISLYRDLNAPPDLNARAPSVQPSAIPLVGGMLPIPTTAGANNPHLIVVGGGSEKPKKKKNASKGKKKTTKKTKSSTSSTKSKNKKKKSSSSKASKKPKKDLMATLLAGFA